jgi:hypothetical protein
MTKKTRTMYMHTWQRNPMWFDRRSGKLYQAVEWGAISSHPATLVASLRTIRRQQERAWNAETPEQRKSYNRSREDYSYIRVEIPSE